MDIEDYKLAKERSIILISRTCTVGYAWNGIVIEVLAKLGFNDRYVGMMDVKNMESSMNKFVDWI